MSNPDDYTVGWICALSTEYVAAQAFLDDRHDAPESVAKCDNNNYTLGRVGKHNVVIAVLPDGEYGTASAAIVARDLLQSFSNVRIGLMVGIGGGAPSQDHDIRLGDVVVSAPRNGLGGVFQYDFGRTIQNQSFEAMAYLNQPPTVLRTAVSGLRSHRPARTSDRLYRSNIIHPMNGGTVSCAEICGDDAANLVFRPERTEYEDNPAIHYGLIASANQLMKDATIRDYLAADKGVLCFEMEAAGLMNHLPCLVIRGICDYADSHKNKEWQGYAAMVAAAYAKDLLYQIPVNKVEMERKIGEILIQVAGTVENMRSNLESEEDIEILDWITPSEYGPQQSDYIKRRQPETCQWFLDSAEYQTWLIEINQTLFCPGIPGAGKTILTAVVIDDLTIKFSKGQDIGFAYIYCNFRRQGEQKFENLVATLLKQLSRRRPSLPVCVKELYDNYKETKTRPSDAEITKALQSVAAMFSKIFIIVDALDECEVYNHSRSRFLSCIFGLRDVVVTNLFATSRYIPDIEKEFQGSPKREISAREADIRQYIDSHMIYLPDFLSKRADIKEIVRNKISKAAQGMFLLATLYFDTLKDKTSISEVNSALENLDIQNRGAGGEDGLRAALEQAYEEAMVRIDSQGQGRQRLGRKAISWIAFAKRPLKTLELQNALAVRPTDNALDEDNVREIGIIVSVCAGLVTVDEESGVVRLTHYTTQEYFDQTKDQWFPDAETEITRICCTYLSFSIFESGFCERDRKFYERLESNPLYSYAATYWGDHARGLSDLPCEVQKFLACQENVEASIQVLVDSFPGRYDCENGFDNRSQEGQVTGLHLAAFFGIRKMVDLFVQQGQDLNLKDIYGLTPLIYTAMKGHEGISRLLLEKGARVDYKGSRERGALHWAVECGHETIVQLLLEEGADIEGNWRTIPLCVAAEFGHDDVVRLLLKKGAAIDTNRGYYTPLVCATRKGHKSTVQLLLKEGASIDITLRYGPEEGKTALSFAAERGFEDIARLLLNHDADINAKNKCGETPLTYAINRLQTGMVQLMLERRAIATGVLSHALSFSYSLNKVFQLKTEINMVLHLSCTLLLNMELETTLLQLPSYYLIKELRLKREIIMGEQH
ncbi:hypothetical protein ACHAQJ_001732 [Trichoderma viride]